LNLSAPAAYWIRMDKPYAPEATIEPAPGAFDTLERLRKLETLLDRQFSIAGIRFGLDSVIGLVPVVGDVISGALPIVGDLFDVAFKSNTKNIRLLISHLEREERKIAKAAARNPRGRAPDL
jgi:hypothetical protein